MLRSFNLRTLALLTCLFLLGSANGAVTSWDFLKGVGGVQSADNTAPSKSFFIVDGAVDTANVDDATSITLTGASLSGSIAYVQEGTEWFFERNYETEVAMDEEFPSGGTFTITLIGPELGTLVQSVTFGPKSHPPLPVLSGTTFSDLQSLDSASAFQVTFAEPGQGVNGGEIVIVDSLTDDWVLDNDLSVSVTDFTIPANALDPGASYVGQLYHYKAITLSGIGGFGVDGSSTHDAITNFDIATVGSPLVGSLVGAWQFGDGAADDSGVLVFLSNGTYFHGQDSVADGTGVDGMERGTYTWNESTGAFTATPIVDTNGEFGLSHPIGSFVFTVNGDVLTVVDNSESALLSRVVSNSSAIVGGWQFGDGTSSGSGVVVILGNGTFLMAEDSEVDDQFEFDGMERGTYTWDSGTGAFFATVEVDTNGEIGLSHPRGAITITIANGVLSYIENGENGENGEIAQLNDVNTEIVGASGAVNSWSLLKMRGGVQSAVDTSPSASFWMADIYLETQNPGDITAASISGGNIAGSRALAQDENTWWLGVEYNSEVEFDAEFPSGTSYTISVSGGTLGALDQVVNLPGKDYPSNAPHFTKFTEMGSVDATSDFEVTSNSVGNTTQSWLEVIPDIDIYEDPPLSAFTIPADTFSGASNNTATLAFVKSLEVDTGGFGLSDGHAGHALLVQAPLNTAGSGNPPGVTFWKFIKGIGRTQTADNTAPAASSWAIDINVETEYASDATSVTISGGGIVGSRMFKYDDEDAEWYFETDFDSEVDLDAEFPSATTYTITLSGGTLGTLVQDVALPAKAYPNVPYLTGTDFTDIQSLDPAADFIANFNPPGSLTQNSGRTVFEVFAGYDADDVFRVEAQGATDSGTIPGTTLASSTGYYGYLEYTHSANIDGNGGFGVDGTVSHNLATDFRIGTPMSPLVGAWQFGDGASDDSGVLVFLPNGVYFHGEDTIADGSDVDGMERGTYTWNDSTGALTATPIVDTNGEIGLSHPIGSFVFTVNGDVLTAGDSEGSQPLNRVTSQSDPLVGAWQFGDGAADSSGVGVILDNGIYFLMDDVESGGADEDGLERGGFIWNSGTGVFTATPVVDTNGEGGLSHPIGGFLFVVTGDVLTVTDDEESTVLNRVGAPNSILPAWIWDYDLERTISETIEKGDAPVTVLDVQGLISLSASGLNISILLGLEDAVNLRMLDLSSNRIRDLGPLSGLVGLEKLDLSSNEISDLSPIAGLTNLIFLDISDNLLEDPAPASEPQGDVIRVFSESQPNAGDSVLDALSAMSKLKALLLGNNKIRNLEILEELILLTEIDLSNNLVTDLTPLAALVLLEEINLSNNLVVDLTPLVNLAELSEVTLFGNLIDTTEGSAQRELLEQIAENSGAIIVLIDSGPGLRVSFDSVSNQFELIWSGSGVLQSSGNLNNWVDIDSAESPYAIPSLSGPDVATFWRLRKSE